MHVASGKNGSGGKCFDDRKCFGIKVKSWYGSWLSYCDDPNTIKPNYQNQIELTLKWQKASKLLAITTTEKHNKIILFPPS